MKEKQKKENSSRNKKNFNANSIRLLELLRYDVREDKNHKVLWKVYCQCCLQENR